MTRTAIIFLGIILIASGGISMFNGNNQGPFVVAIGVTMAILAGIRR